MRTAIRVWRVLLWIWGVVFVLPAGFGLWMEIADPRRHRDLLSIALMVLFFVASLVGPICAVGMRRGTRWARRFGWIATSIQTLAFPLFLPLGIFGLVLLFRGAGKAEMRSRAAPSSRLTGSIVLIGTLLGVKLVVDGFFHWAARLGYPTGQRSPIGDAIMFGIMVGICLLVGIAIHEAGHAMAVKFVGGHIHHFRIGPLWWRRESGRTWMEFWWRSPAGGSVGWTPGSGDRLARQKLLVTSAGSLANFVFVLIALTMFPWLGKLGIPGAWIWVMNLVLFELVLLGNLVPVRREYQNTDGATMSDLLTSSDIRRLYEIFGRQSMSDSSEWRPREWPRGDVEWALALEDVGAVAPSHAAVLQAGCAHYLDSGDTAEAVVCARRLQDLAREHPKRCSPNSFPEATFALAFYGGDLQGARELWARRPVGLPVQFELAERLALAAIAGEDRAAAIGQAWECSALYGSCGTLEYLRDQLRRLETGLVESFAITEQCENELGG
jgi:hypothetical protein